MVSIINIKSCKISFDTATLRVSTFKMSKTSNRSNKIIKISDLPQISSFTCYGRETKLEGLEKFVRHPRLHRSHAPRINHLVEGLHQVVRRQNSMQAYVGVRNFLFTNVVESFQHCSALLWVPGAQEVSYD